MIINLFIFNDLIGTFLYDFTLFVVIYCHMECVIPGRQIRINDIF